MRPCALFSLLSSLFFLLSSIPPEDAERARPWRLHMRDGFCRRNHDPPLKCSDSSRRSTSLWEAVRCWEGSAPLWRLHFGTSGGLLGSVCSLLSSLFSLLLVVVVLRRLDPMRRVTHSTHDKPCQFSCCCSDLERLALSALRLWRPGEVCPLAPLFFLPSHLFARLSAALTAAPIASAALCFVLSGFLFYVPTNESLVSGTAVMLPASPATMLSADCSSSLDRPYAIHPMLGTG